MAPLIQEIIRAKRNGAVLPPQDIRAFVTALTDGTASEGQVAALAMAVFLKGMARDETVTLTEAMRDSGTVLAWPEIDRPIVDKHSTGGVGDNVSLMLAPIVAACGAAVPMISGRGLGHTGGTLDKMGTIPGYAVQPDEALFRKVVGDVGCAIIGQTADLAPADKRFYAIRDTTGTVESIPLITASILSKKLAAGLQSLVLDVKFGNGAFMDSADKAKALATSLVEVAHGAGLNAVALLTDMNEPLASAAGNALEVVNAIDFLTGAHRDPRLEMVTLKLAAAMLRESGLATDLDDGEAMARRALEDGRATETFAKMVAALGGPTDLVEAADSHLEGAPVIADIVAPHAGRITGIDARAVGLAVVALGGGRRVATDAIDPAVGFDRLAACGAMVDAREPIARVHARNQSQVEVATEAIRAAYQISQDAFSPRPVVAETVQIG